MEENKDIKKEIQNNRINRSKYLIRMFTISIIMIMIAIITNIVTFNKARDMSMEYFNSPYPILNLDHKINYKNLTSEDLMYMQQVKKYIDVFNIGIYGFLIKLLFYIATVIYKINISIKRCHDFNVSGWGSLFTIIPFVWIIFCFIPGTKGPNKYGEIPKKLG